MKPYYNMNRSRLTEILNRMNGVKIGLLGDICLDIYWHADMRKSELSRETPHFPLPVVEERMSLGGGGNVAANMAALNPEKLAVFSVIGSDWRGKELMRLLEKLDSGFSNGVVTDSNRVTNAYIKPMRKGFSDVEYEDPRLDFTSYKPLSWEVEDELVKSLDRAAEELDVLCISDQMPYGVVTERVRAHACCLARQGLRVVADSRDRIGLFSGVILKPNEIEGTAAAGLNPDELSSAEDFAAAAHTLASKTGNKVFMTLGAKGSLYADAKETWYIPARKIDKPIDFCGAGDSSLSGFGMAIGAGAEPWEAAYIAGLCSEVTIRQIGVTGTASRTQVLKWHSQLEI